MPGWMYQISLYLVSVLCATIPKFARQWSKEIAWMNTEKEHLSSSNGLTFAWLEGTELRLRRLGSGGNSGNLCRVHLNPGSESLKELMSLPGGLELCSLGNGPNSSSLLVVDAGDTCRAAEWQISHGQRVLGPFLVPRSDGAVDIFYQTNGDTVRPCAAELCRQIYQSENNTMTPFRPFRQSIIETGNYASCNFEVSGQCCDIIVTLLHVHMHYTDACLLHFITCL
jgi:hypothetical protein